LLALHDAAADGQGNIWVLTSSQDAAYVRQKLDPKTGIVTEYTIPLTPGSMPGTAPTPSSTKNGIAWIFGKTGRISSTGLDPRTGDVKQVRIESKNSH